MDEIDYQLSLQLLDRLADQGLITTVEREEIIRKLQEYYQPQITLLTG